MATTRQRIQLRRDTAAAWTAANPTLAQGEPGFETDTGLLKIGDGTTAWAALSYTSSPLLEGLNDVTTTDKVDGSVLIYSSATSKFVADDVNTKLTLTDGGNF